MEKSDTVKRAVVLLSGGVDSSTTLAIAKEKGFEAYAISFDYGQRNSFEISSSREIASALGAKEHIIFNLNLRTLGRFALTGDIDVPKRNAEGEGRCRDGSSGRKVEAEKQSVPVTYVPARNTIFLSVALCWAEALGARDIFIGANVLDYSGYPDCRPEYIKAFEKAANLGTASGKIKIHSPLINMTKAEIVKMGVSLGVDYSLTQSCYDPAPTGAPCLECESCVIRTKGFVEAGVSDRA